MLAVSARFPLTHERKPTNMQLEQALTLLDPANDDHWTHDGLPLVDVLRDLTDDQSLSRKTITNSAPDLTRAKVKAFADGEDELDESPIEPIEVEVEPEIEVAPIEPDLSPAEHEDGVPVDVFTLPIHEVLADRELTDIAIQQMAEMIDEGNASVKAMKEELAQLNAKNELLKRAALLHSRNRPNNERRSDIQRYLEGQNAARAKRAERAQRFIDAGTTAQDVAEQLSSKSKLDASMATRKAARGSQRPPHRNVG